MKKKTLDLNRMNVQSFVTSFDKEDGRTLEVKGGYCDYTTPYDGCLNWTKPAGACTNCTPIGRCD